MPEANTVEAPKGKLKPGNVWCRILKRGHDKIFTGETKASQIANGQTYAGESAFPRYQFGEVVQLPLTVAQAQEDAGNLEIQD